MQEIKVTISREGEISYEVRGIKGRGCKELTRAIDALGNLRETKTTGEYCQVDQGQQLKQGR